MTKPADSLVDKDPPNDDHQAEDTTLAVRLLSCLKVG